MLSLSHFSWSENCYYLARSTYHENIMKYTCICTDSDFGVCSRSWLWLALGKDHTPLFVTGSLCIPVKKKTLGWTVVVLCACGISQLFCVVAFVITAVHKLGIKLVIIWNTSQMVTRGKKVMKWHRPMFLKGSIYPPLPRLLTPVLRDCTHAVQVNCSLLSKGHYKQD